MASLIPCLKNAKWREISKIGLGKISCVSNIPHGEADLSVFLRHNRFRVPIHFPTDPFTSEKFPPPPPLLQPKSDAGHHKTCIHGQMQQHAIFASQTLPSKTCKSRCHELFAHKTNSRVTSEWPTLSSKTETLLCDSEVRHELFTQRRVNYRLLNFHPKNKRQGHVQVTNASLKHTNSSVWFASVSRTLLSKNKWQGNLRVTNVERRRKHDGVLQFVVVCCSASRTLHSKTKGRVICESPPSEDGGKLMALMCVSIRLMISCCIVLQCVAVGCSVLQCVAVRCSVCCNVL